MSVRGARIWELCVLETCYLLQFGIRYMCASLGETIFLSRMANVCNGVTTRQNACICGIIRCACIYNSNT